MLEISVLELYHFYGATCGLKARLAVHEKRASVEFRAVDRAFLKTPAYLALNPNGVVPTLVHDGAVLTESTVIINYLDDLWANWPLKPPDALGAAYALWWMKRADEGLPYIGILTYTVSMRPGLAKMSPDALQLYLDAIPSPSLRARRSRIIHLGYDNPDFLAAIAGLRSLFDDMEAVLSQRAWLAGDDYTLADLAITPLMERVGELAFEGLWQANRPQLGRWWDRIRSRPSYESCVLAAPNPEASQHRAYGEEAWRAGVVR